jgi:hypothetical protein
VTTVADVLARLDDVRPTRRGWSARCPAHSDTSPSLSVLESPTGRAIVTCFAGCDREAIYRALDLEAPRPARRRERGSLLDEARHEILAAARREPWARPGVLDIYRIADHIRRCRRAVAVARAAAGKLGDHPQSWDLLARSAAVEIAAEMIEAEADE